VSQSIGYVEQIVVKNRAKEIIIHRIAAALTRCVHRFCQINVFVSNGLKRSYGNDRRISWIVNDSSIFEQHIVSPSALRSGCQSPPRVLFVGRLCPEKGIHTLISAIAQLEIPVELYIAGDGPQKSELQLQAADAGIAKIVHFLGVMPWGERLFSLMQDADLLVVPSTAEGLGLVLIEAMANGLVPIASAVGGIPDIVTDDVNGILVEPSNPDQLCKAIERLLQNDTLRAQMQLAGLQTAAENTMENQRCRMFRHLGMFVKSSGI
jgi:glycosyltransferase involved in cell wall biosynthesis